MAPSPTADATRFAHLLASFVVTVASRSDTGALRSADNCSTSVVLLVSHVLAPDGTTITTNRPVLLDVGAAGKGRLVDLVAHTLTDADIHRFVIDAGGDLRHNGERSLRIGLEHPLNPERVVGIVDLRGNALCASAVNRRAWGDRHPCSRRPASAFVVAHLVTGVGGP
jgi:hypothetical protein